MKNDNMIPRRKGFIDIMILVVFTIIIVVLFSQMVINKVNLEYRVILKSTDSIGTRAAFNLLNLSLATGWEGMAENVLINVLENGFGENIGYNGRYGYIPTSGAMYHPELGCNGEGVCIPGLNDIGNNLTQNVSNAANRMPTQLSVRYQDSDKTARLEWKNISFRPTLDRTALKLLQHAEVSGTDTTISLTYPMEINIVPRLSRMAMAAMQLVGGLTQARWSVENSPATSKQLQSLREAVLEKSNKRIADAVVNAFQTADYGSIDIFQRWSVQNGNLMFGYTGSGRIDDGREGIVSGLVKCQGGEDPDSDRYVENKKRSGFYNTWAGTFESANIDRLLPYAESPGSLIGAISETGNSPSEKWHRAAMLFGDYTDTNRDTHKIVRENVDRLISSMKKASENVISQEILIEGLALFHAGFPARNFTNSTDYAWALQVNNTYWQWRHIITGGEGNRTCMFGEDVSANAPGQGWGIGWPVKGNARSRLITSCYGDSSCSGNVPIGRFNHGIDIAAGSVDVGESVYAAADGIIQRVDTDASPNGIGTYIMIRHIDSDGNLYSTVYGYLRSVTYPWQSNPRITKGTQIGFSGLKTTQEGSIPMLHFRVVTQSYSFNPCIWLGCVPDTPYASAADAVLPDIRPVAGPYEYAEFLKTVNTKVPGSTLTDVILGDDFCSPDDNIFRGEKLAYNFYGEVGEGGTAAWVVTPAYGGEVVKIESNWFGCYGAVWVKTGNFIVSYGHIAPRNTLQLHDIVVPGDSIGNVRKITGIGVFPKICREPPLEVRIFGTSFVLPEEDEAGDYNACGSRMNCHNIISYENPDGTMQYWAPGDMCSYSEGCFISKHHCASLEWNSLFKPRFSGMWQEMPARKTFERAGANLILNLSDNMNVMDCTLNNNKRFRWHYENDSACINESFVICAKDYQEAGIEGAHVITDGDTAGNGTYYCVSRDAWNSEEFYLPDISQSVGSEAANNYLNYLGRRQLSRICTSNETNENWLCCLGSGSANMIMICEPHSWVIDGDDLKCVNSFGCEEAG